VFVCRVPLRRRRCGCCTCRIRCHHHGMGRVRLDLYLCTVYGLEVRCSEDDGLIVVVSFSNSHKVLPGSPFSFFSYFSLQRRTQLGRWSWS
jgi:hypothetical protein